MLEAVSRTERIGMPWLLWEFPETELPDALPFIDPFRDTVRATITRAWIEQELAELAPSEASWASTAEAFRAALRHHPGDPKLHAGLVDALRRSDDPVAERLALEQALLVNQRKRLDPLVQFSDARRQEYERRLKLRQSSK